MEKMYGHTPDISMFRFRFWEPVWYYEPTAKYPAPNFLPGCFIGIAWDHGDAFTYKIWTTPNNNWKQGRELVRNVVRSRHLEKKEPVVSYQDEDLLFSKTQPSRTQRPRSKKRNSCSNNSRGAEEVTLDGSELESLVRFDDTPPITSVDSEEQGGNKAESQSIHFSPVEVETSHGDELYEDSESKATNSTINSKRARKEVDNSALQSFDPLNNNAEVKMTSKINNYLDTNKSAASGAGGAHVTKIVGHNWMDG
jgi:hypothetical protein